ncbi:MULTISPECIES: hypothetical protein [unclassified Coleofasciculus]|uniref:hypothetical protein n=1 Tax=unclassified Coleofasciculus TaxID=2692782 RepID=UPI00188257C0|nr:MULTISPECIES: hypothetical protein [unclassified Coleofasciculus]MBE9128210.1 hypothetical protein [Coleofasciculus sp. LEGE 07081]MBE9150948.1 hypothetical protein [Coleofasciculus sp. LEGE 07092]
MFDNNYRPHDEGDFLGERKETNQLKFYRSIGNWAEFGLYFSGGLALAFVPRLIPVPGIWVFYSLVNGVGFGYLVISYLGGDGDRRELGAIALALIAAAIGGHWDAVWRAVQYFLPHLLIGTALIVGFTLLLLPNRRDRI